MDEFMKEKITNQECEFFVGKSGYGDFVYYKIPGVSKYYLRHDGKIVVRHHHDVNVSQSGLADDICNRIIDLSFGSFEEAIAFLNFFHITNEYESVTETRKPYMIFAGGDHCKTFNDLMNYVDVKPEFLTGDILITTEEVSEDRTEYKIHPLTPFIIGKMDKEEPTLMPGINHSVLKPIDLLHNTYFITGGQQRIMFQMELNKSQVSDNKMMRTMYGHIDPDHYSRLAGYHFYTLKEVIDAFTIWNTRGLIQYNEEVTIASTGMSYTQNFIRIFDKNDKEITFLIESFNEGVDVDKIDYTHPVNIIRVL